jgi:Flp pilus assembly protein TadG
MMRFLAKLRRDNRGVSAVEFALIAPAMIATYFGMAEISQALLAERKAAHAASAVGDLVTQSSSVSSADVTEIFNIAATIMSPYSTASLKMRVSSLTADAAGTPKVDWSSGWGLTALSTGATVTGVPTGLMTAGQSVVLSEVTYTYDSPVNMIMTNAVTFTRKFYLRPRKSDKVAKTN